MPRPAGRTRPKRLVSAAAFVAGITGALGAGACSTAHCDRVVHNICYTRTLAPPVPAPAAAAVWHGWPGVLAAGPVRPALHATVPAPSGGTFLALAVSSDGSRLLTVDDGGDVTERNLRTGAATALPAASGIQDAVTGTGQSAAAVSPGLGALAVTGDSQVDVQQTGSGTDLGDFPARLRSGETGSDLVLSADGRWLAFADSSGGVHLVDLVTRASKVLKIESAAAASYEGGAESLAFNPDGSEIAVGTTYGTIGLWAVASGTLLATLSDPVEKASSGAPGVSALAFGEAGALLAAADDDANVYLWNVSQRSVVGALPGTPAKTKTIAYSAAFSQDGRLLAVSFADGTVRLWSAATGARLAVLHSGQFQLIDPVAFGLGGSVLATFGPAGGIAEWSLG